MQPKPGGVTLTQTLRDQSQTMLQLLPEQPAGQAFCAVMLPMSYAKWGVYALNVWSYLRRVHADGVIFRG